MNKEQIIDAFMFRHACKEFDDSRKIPPADFEFILETARLSPSSFGLEPWKFLVIQNPQLRQKLLPAVWGAGKQLPTASHVVLSLAKKSHFMKFDSEYVDNFMHQVQNLPDDVIALRKKFYQNFQETDFNLLESERAMTDWAIHQTYIALGNMMTAAAMIGIDSCPVEGFHRQKLEALLAEEIQLNLEQYSVAYLVTFGYRKNPPKAKTRQTKEQVFEFYE
jgi:nitroreductase